MGTSPLMSMGIKAMAANYAALQTTSHNIANANVAGYSRQQVELATAQGQFSGAGFFGKGVDVVAVTRSHNEFLTREAASARALAGMDAARLEQLQRLEGVFRSGEAGLGHASSELPQCHGRPGQPPCRRRRAPGGAGARRRPGRALRARSARRSTSRRPASHAELAGHGGRGQQPGPRASPRSTSASPHCAASGQPANDLLDERERLISELSQHVKISRIEADDGSMAIFIGGGQRLVLGSRGGDAAGGAGRRRPVALRAGDRGRRHRRGRSAKRRWAAARSPACCASRTRT